MTSNNTLFKEWQECRKSIARFDEIIVNIRKYGFTLITILLSADGFLYAKVGNPQKIEMFGIYFALMVLIVGLFRVDRYHEVFLRGAVHRACILEDKILEDKKDMGLSTMISLYSERLKTATWGVGLYILFCAANYSLIIGTILSPKKYNSLHNSLIGNIKYIIVVTILALIVIGHIFFYHRRMKRNEKKLMKEISTLDELKSIRKGL